MKINAEKLKDAEIIIVRSAQILLETSVDLDGIDGLPLDELTPKNCKLDTNENAQQLLCEPEFSIYRKGYLVLNSGTMQDVRNYLEKKLK